MRNRHDLLKPPRMVTQEGPKKPKGPVRTPANAPKNLEVGHWGGMLNKERVDYMKNCKYIFLP